ncbi:MAG: pre-peptidase C-terminal domain-containing protein [Crocinitomicaceae bacterium]|nr:pre-peptidase C-terminal domain-containing protein [Crocinitomicaceae bacterium]
MKKSFKHILLVACIAIYQLSFGQGTNTPCASGSPVATVLTPGTTCTYVAGTTVGATYQTDAANAGTPSCASPGAADVWFQFTAPAGGNVTIDLGSGTITDSGMELYTGSCGSWTSVDCDDDGGTGAMSQITATGLVAGQVYMIRVWEYSSGTGTFTICVQDNIGGGGGGPANDNPCTATAVPVNGTCTYASYTNAGATDSGLADPGCANYSGGDVWFTATVPASGNLIFDTNTGGVTDGGMAIYTGTCGSLTLLSCNDDGSANGLMPMISQPGLTPGSTVWIQVWEYGNDNNGTFSLCVQDAGGGALTNDDPCAATTIAVNSTCSYNTYTTSGATDSGLPDPGCSWYNGGDVWFQLTVPASGAITFDSDNTSFTDGGMAIYSGTCGSLTLIDCDDDASANGAMPMIAATGLTPGSTIFVQFWEYGNDLNGTFQLCVYETAPPPPPPGNISCTGMEPICSDTPITFTASTSDDDADVVNPGNDYGCLFTSPNPTWFYLELLTGGVVSINMSAGSDIDFALWGPYSNLAAAQADCDSYPVPFDCSYSTSGTEQANVPAAVANEVYVLLVTNYADVTQVIDLNSGAGNTALTDCSIILPIELESIFATAEMQTNTIHWATLSELANDHFVVERSIDGTHFTQIGIVDGAGNSSEVNQYEFADREISNDIIYYRLKQVDFDGDYHYSTIVSVNRKTDVVIVYPNPSSGNITIDFPKTCDGTYTIKYKDSLGKEFSEKAEISSEILSYSSSLFESLPSGIYFVEIADENGNLISIQKVIKSKLY